MFLKCVIPYYYKQYRIVNLFDIAVVWCLKFLKWLVMGCFWIKGIKNIPITGSFVKIYTIDESNIK